jgi:endonuclease YncB( thermonuclease family)
VIEAVQIFWSPAGANLPALGARALVDVTDGDTPNVRMPIRMLSVDTPEVTARSEERAAAIDQEFKQLAAWIREGKAPIEAPLAEFLLPKLETGNAGTLHYHQGLAASAFGKHNIETRLTKPDGTKRKIFVRTADSPFDSHNRLLAYVAPEYSPAELRAIPRDKRPTFNLDLVANGWAAPFVIYPSIPGALDLPLLIEAAANARSAGLGIWAYVHMLLPYEYRAMERLFQITRKKVNRVPLEPGEEFSWRERYCVDMRTRVLHGPEDYFGIDPEFRLWLWPKDVAEAVGRLNLVPAPRLVGAG